MPTATGTKHATKHATAKVRDTKAMRRAKKSKNDEPSALTPTVVETMHATVEVGGTKVIPRATESTTS